MRSVGSSPKSDKGKDSGAGAGQAVTVNIIDKKPWWKRAVSPMLRSAGYQDGGGVDKIIITLLLFMGYLLFYLYERYTIMIEQKEKLKEYY